MVKRAFLTIFALALSPGCSGTANAQQASPAAKILTPPPPPAPRINGPAVFAVRPGSPVSYTMPVTGTRPITYSAKGLPKSLAIDAATGRMTGSVAKSGTYRITLRAANARGATTRMLRLVVGDTIALTPPLGWNSYNAWGSEVTQPRVLAAARAMVSSGLADHGWSYINIDDGWQGKRDRPGTLALQPDPERFTDIRAMADMIHAMGLKVGIYHSPWIRTYAGRMGGSADDPQGLPQTWPQNVPKNAKRLPYAIGRYSFTATDAAQFADWGIDYLKYDWGPIEYPETKAMSDALRAQRRDIAFSISNNHVRNLFGDIGRISTVANAWRTTTDINDSWTSVADQIGFQQDAWAPFARPGHYNDADMLVVGRVGWGQANRHPTRLTPDEQYSHVSLWALLASPLLIGADMERLDAFTLGLLTNDEVLAVDQDPLVKQAVQVAGDTNFAVYRKPLEDGSIAVGLFNRSAAPATVTARWTDLGITRRQEVRDLWRQKSLGTFGGSFAAVIPSHGVRLIRMTQR